MEQSNELILYIRYNLGISKKAEVKFNTQWQEFDFDIEIDDDDKLFLFQVRPRAIVDDLALFHLYEAYRKDSPEIEDKLRFVLVTKSMSDRLWNVARKLDIEILTVPSEIGMPQAAERVTQAAIKITSEKSWKVVSGLIRLRSTPIMNLSIVQGLSYGWTCSTIRYLVEIGAAKRSRNLISVADLDKLINGVVRERPTQSLIVRELRLPGRDIFEVAGELTGTLDLNRIPHAFTGFLAGARYSGHNAGHNSLQLYMEKRDIDSIQEIITLSKEGAGIKLQLMVPDRKIFNEAREIGEVRVVSPAQTLLDLAGLGYEGKEPVKALVDVYSQL